MTRWKFRRTGSPSYGSSSFTSKIAKIDYTHRGSVEGDVRENGNREKRI